MRPDLSSHIGKKIGNIRLVSVLGSGGMGSVYSGFDHKLKRTVAVKAIHKKYCLHEGAKARFLREARILSQLQHPYICIVHDYIEGDDNDFHRF